LNRVRIFTCLFIILMMSPGPVFSLSVNAIALFKDRAMLSINGGKPKIIRAGKTYAGVKLISSNTSEAVIEIDGKREKITLNSSLVLNEQLGAKASSSYAQSIELFVNERGFFQSQGEINGKEIVFLVDTGANLVVLNSIAANRIGLSYKDGEKTQAATASGVAPMFLVNVETMSIGGIVLNNIQTGVIEGSFPESPLLGMSFLSRLNMERNGDVMTLKRR